MKCEQPTCRLRFVLRWRGTVLLRILQQQWVLSDSSPIVYEWRDVPEEPE
jgi:hypothetical protein